jgi:hypothetical protein
LRGIASSNPSFAPYIWPVLAVYIAFALLTWIGVPLANLLLRLSRYGRYALSRHQRIGSNFFGLHLLLLALCAGMFFWRGGELWATAALVAALMVLPVASLLGHIGLRSFGRLALIVAGLGCVGVAWIIAEAIAPGSDGANMLAGVFLLGFVGVIWFVVLAGGMGRLG